MITKEILYIFLNNLSIYDQGFFIIETFFEKLLYRENKYIDFRHELSVTSHFFSITIFNETNSTHI